MTKDRLHDREAMAELAIELLNGILLHGEPGEFLACEELDERLSRFRLS